MVITISLKFSITEIVHRTGSLTRIILKFSEGAVRVTNKVAAVVERP